MPVDDVILEKVIAEVCKNASYARIDGTLVRKIAMQELEKRKSPKEAVKATRSKLHQVGTVYLDSVAIKPPPIASSIQTIDIAAQKAWCRPYLQQHISTRERLPFLDEFFSAIFAVLPPVHRVLDLACGLTPLCRPWMPLAADVPYTGWDIFSDVIEIVNTFFRRYGYAGQAEVHDLTGDIPLEKADVVFLLKTLPCLEQLQKGFGEQLLKTLQANTLVISFPAKSLGGRNKGMVSHYDAYLQGILDETLWQVDTLPFPNETVYVLQKRALHA